MLGPLIDITPENQERPQRRTGPSPRPVDAASLVVIDRSKPEPRFLMGRRHSAHRFMPDFVVFPGGRVDPEDRRMSAFGALQSETERQLMTHVVRPSASRARALALCAIRETCEETGLLIGEGGLGAPEEPPQSWSPFKDQGVYPSLEALHFVARAITPPGHSKRFDARFFAVDAGAIAARIDVGIGPQSELVELMWLTAEETASERCARVTRVIIREVVARLEAGLERPLPVPFLFERNGRWLRGEIQ